MQRHGGGGGGRGGGEAAGGERGERGGGGGEGDAQTVSHDDKPVKCPFDPTGYDKDLVEALERDIVQTNPNVKWWVRGIALDKS